MCLAVPGKVIEVSGEELARTARVDFSGAVMEVSLAYTPEAKPGDYVIVHVGFALSVIDPEEAQKVFEDLRQIESLGAAESKDK